MKRRAFFGAALAAPASVALARPFESRREDAAASDDTRAKFPNVALTTHEGRRVRFYDDVIRGNKINIVNVMYTQCPEICGGASVNLARVQALLGSRMGRDVFIWSITLDARRDTPAVLARYAEIVGAGPGWKFLTGRAGHIERIRRAMGFVDSDPVADRDLAQHTGMVRAGNDALDRWIMCPAMQAAPQLMQEALWVGLAQRA